MKIDREMTISRFRHLSSFLSAEKLDRINRFRFMEDKQRTLLGDLMMRFFAAKYTGMAMRDVVFEKNSYGKPVIKEVPELCMNISHAGDWVVCALGSEPVGVDIEKVGIYDPEISRRFFTGSEHKTLMQAHGDKRDRFFYELWTLKESYIKAIGKGLCEPLDAFEFSGDGEKAIWFIEEANKNLFFRQYSIEEGYCLSACGHEPEFAESVQQMTVTDLI